MKLSSLSSKNRDEVDCHQKGVPKHQVCTTKGETESVDKSGANLM